MRPRHHEGRRPPLRSLAIITPIALAAGGMLAVTPAIGTRPPPLPRRSACKSLPTGTSPAATVFRPGKLNCLVIKNTAAHPTAQTVRPDAIPSGNGYGPSTVPGRLRADRGVGRRRRGHDGRGRRRLQRPDRRQRPGHVPVRGGPARPDARASSPCTTRTAQTSPLPATAPTSDDWTLEESLDVDMVSAICPLCKIDLVEATNDSGTGLYVAEETAATTLGAKYISNSWGGSESSTDLTYDSEYFGVSGVVYTASAGDSAYSGGVIYPATSPHVVSVGGTTLNTSSNSRGWTESVWETSSTEGTGSGCSAYEPQPSWQSSISIITAACSHRVDNDVAADADPNTGAAVYDTTNGNGGWNEVGGTSESSPMIAAVFALAGNNGNGGNNAADSIYTHTGNLYEVTGGSNGTCGALRPVHRHRRREHLQRPDRLGHPERPHRVPEQRPPAATRSRSPTPATRPAP